MAVQFRINNLDRVRKVLVRIEAFVVRPLQKMTNRQAQNVVAPMRNFDRRHFISLSRRGWPKISIPALVWNRVRDRTGQPYKTLSGARQGARKAAPLMDTQRLWRSLWQRNHKDLLIKIDRGHNPEIVFGTKVPYAAKHTEPKARTFTFGKIHQRRHERRFRKPKKGEFKLVRRRAEPLEKELIDRQVRPFYVLRSWARTRYPFRTKLPRRTWIREYPSEINQQTAKNMSRFLGLNFRTAIK